MGAIHAGHLALVERARELCDRVVVSVFVNPKQFDRAGDLDAYPRMEARDAATLADAGADLMYAPTPAVMYPDGFATTVRVVGVTEMLEGPSRPGHFEGVATVVTKLLLQALPGDAFFGEKDYQQLAVVRRLVADLDIPVRVHGVPIVREADGLALSSRNQNLTPAQRDIAPALAAALRRAAARLTAGEDATTVLVDAADAVRAAGFERVDYLELRDAANLAPLTRADRAGRLLAAAWLGPVRLIDNIAVEPAA